MHSFAQLEALRFARSPSSGEQRESGTRAIGWARHLHVIACSRNEAQNGVLGHLSGVDTIHKPVPLILTLH